MCKLHLYKCSKHNTLIDKSVRLCCEGKLGKLCIQQCIVPAHINRKHIISTTHQNSLLVEDLMECIVYYTKCKYCNTNKLVSTDSNIDEESSDNESYNTYSNSICTDDTKSKLSSSNNKLLLPRLSYINKSKSNNKV